MDDIKKMYEALYRNLIEEHSKVFEAQDVTDIEKFMAAVMSAKRLFVVGAGREGIAARSFAMRLMHLGKETYWLWDDITPGMGKGDLFIVINGSGKIGHIDYLVDQARLTGADIAVVTGAPLERTPSLADTTLFIPACVYKGTDSRVITSTQPMGNLFEQHLFLLFDIIIMMLERKMALSHDQMEARHRNIE